MSNKQRKVKISSVGSSLKPFSPRVIERERKKKKKQTSISSEACFWRYFAKQTLWKASCFPASFSFWRNGAKHLKTGYKKESVDNWKHRLSNLIACLTILNIYTLQQLLIFFQSLLKMVISPTDSPLVSCRLSDVLLRQLVVVHPHIYDILWQRAMGWFLCNQ